jgi:uncharacterized protein YjbI with pentapeptide repeats
MKNRLNLIVIIMLVLAVISIFGRSHIIKFIDTYSRDSDIRSYIIASAKVLIPLKDDVFMVSLDEKIQRLKSTGACSFCNLTGANLTNIKFNEYDIRYSNLSSADLRGANFSGVNLKGLSLVDTNLSNTDLTNTSLVDVNLSGANLSGSDLSGANLKGAILQNTLLINADLSDTNLSGVNLSGTNLSGVNLKNSLMIETDLGNSNLSSANLSGSNLSGANLKNSQLIDADLSNTNLFDVDMSNANLSGANLKDSSKVQIKFKNIDDKKWPSFQEMKDLGIKGNVGRYEDIEYLRSKWFNVTNFFLSNNLEFLTTKEGFLYKLNDEQSELSLNLTKDAKFPFADVGYNAGLLDVESNDKFVYISYTSKGKDFIEDGVANYAASIEDYSSLIVDEYSLDFKKVRNIIKIDGFLPTHYGGALEFDSNGKLYLSTGDGGPHGDLENHAQNLRDLRGKILRIDLSKSNQIPEIVAFGLRNPFGVTIDTKDRMFINVCGAGEVETVYLLKELNGKPYNLGWPVFTGTMRLRPNDPLELDEILKPIFEYKTRPGCATGGLVINNSENDNLYENDSYYLFADFYGTIRILKEQQNSEWKLFHEHKQEKYIYNFGFDKKLNKIIVAPYLLELDVIIEPLLFENNEILCNTTISNGLIENSNC